MKQISSSVDAKILPILDPAQQQKFQAMGEEMRRKMVEKLAGEEIHKVETDIKQELESYK